jgi:hypothetical protein
VYLATYDFHDVYYQDDYDEWYPINLKILEDVWELLQGTKPSAGGGAGAGEAAVEVKTAITSWSQFARTGKCVHT